VPLFLDDNPRVTVMEIRAKARRIKARYGGIGLIVIDYLQLMGGSGSSENRQLEVSEISRNLKILARELEVPIIALSQLSRKLEARADKRPMLSDLRESGSLEQDADVVMFLYRDEVYHPDSPDKGSAEVIVAKHRAGPIGTKRLVFLGQYTRFDNAAALSRSGWVSMGSGCRRDWRDRRMIDVRSGRKVDDIHQHGTRSTS
jgi:replicative DNA helicase